MSQPKFSLANVIYNVARGGVVGIDGWYSSPIGQRDRHRMVVGYFTTTCAISAYQH